MSLERAHNRPVETSHKRSVLSRLPETAERPSALRQTEATEEVWPSNVRTHCPVETSHKRSVLSWLPESRQQPSALKQTEHFKLCTWNVRTSHAARSPVRTEWQAAACCKSNISFDRSCPGTWRAWRTETQRALWKSFTSIAASERRDKARNSVRRDRPCHSPLGKRRTSQQNGRRPAASPPIPHRRSVLSLLPEAQEPSGRALSGERPAAVHAQTDGVHRARVPLERAARSARRDLPQAKRFVVASGECPTAVRTQTDGVHRSRVPLERAHTTVRQGLPQTKCLVIASGERPAAIRTQTDGGHRGGCGPRTCAHSVPLRPPTNEAHSRSFRTAPSDHPNSDRRK